MYVTAIMYRDTAWVVTSAVRDYHLAGCGSEQLRFFIVIQISLYTIRRNALRSFLLVKNVDLFPFVTLKCLEESFVRMYFLFDFVVCRSFGLRTFMHKTTAFNKLVQGRLWF